MKVQETIVKCGFCVLIFYLYRLYLLLIGSPNRLSLLPTASDN